MKCRLCHEPKHRGADGKFVHRSEANCSYFRSVYYRLAVEDFYAVIEAASHSLLFFRDEYGRRVNEDPGPVLGGGGCIS